MRAVVVLLACGVLLGAVGCGGSSERSGGSAWSFNPLGGSKSASDGGGRFTIRLVSFSAPNHAALAVRAKQITQEMTGWDNLMVMHRDTGSDLLWGSYDSIDQAQGDLAKAKAAKGREGKTLFAMPLLVALPGPSMGSPELNLQNADGAYSLLVAVFEERSAENYTSFAQDADAYAERLRAHGYEAYYHHGAARSSVTVGCFPATSAQVLSDGKMDRLVVHDRRIEQLKRDPQFEFLALNGMKFKTRVVGPSGQMREDWVRPYLVNIPRKQKAVIGGASEQANNRPGLGQ